MRSVASLCVLLGLAGVCFFSGERKAAACGGCFHEPPPPPPPGAPPDSVDSLITGERMIFSISKDQTTLYDEITYSGSPASFAWVLPIHGEVDVGLSADIMFGTIDQLTAVTVSTPPTRCPATPSTCEFFGGGGYSGGGCAFGGGSSAAETPGAGFAAGDAGTKDIDAGVTVLTQKQVGPYEMVQLKSSDGRALTRWLDANGYIVPKSDVPVISHYVSLGMDFLALKLVPGVGVNAMQPVRVTTHGASPVLPLKMVGVGTGAKTGITLWVVAEGRWEPQNFPFFTLRSSDLSWDWATSSSNFEALRQTKEQESGFKAWQVESSLELAKHSISSTLLTAVQYNASGVGGYAEPTPTPRPRGKDAGAHDAAPASDATSGADGDLADGGTTTSDGGAGEAGAEGGGPGDGAATDGGAPGPDAADTGAPDEAGDAGFAPLPSEQELADRDLAVLFKGISGSNVRVTRLRTDIAHTALDSDLVIRASADQTELSNEVLPANEIGQPSCTVWTSSCGEFNLPRDKAVAYARANYGSYGNSTDSGGGCGCRTTVAPLGWRATLGIFGAMAGLGVVRLAARRRRR